MNFSQFLLILFSPEFFKSAFTGRKRQFFINSFLPRILLKCFYWKKKLHPMFSHAILRHYKIAWKDKRNSLFFSILKVGRSELFHSLGGR